MKRFILAIIPQSWIDEIYYKGRRDAGASLIDASYWFSDRKEIYEAVKMLGEQISEGAFPHAETTRTRIYNKYPKPL